MKYNLLRAEKCKKNIIRSCWALAGRGWHRGIECSNFFCTVKGEENKMYLLPFRTIVHKTLASSQWGKTQAHVDKKCFPSPVGRSPQWALFVFFGDPRETIHPGDPPFLRQCTAFPHKISRRRCLYCSQTNLFLRRPKRLPLLLLCNNADCRKGPSVGRPPVLVVPPSRSGQTGQTRDEGGGTPRLPSSDAAAAFGEGTGFDNTRKENIFSLEHKLLRKCLCVIFARTRSRLFSLLILAGRNRRKRWGGKLLSSVGGGARIRREEGGVPRYPPFPTGGGRTGGDLVQGKRGRERGGGTEKARGTIEREGERRPSWAGRSQQQSRLRLMGGREAPSFFPSWAWLTEIERGHRVGPPPSPLTPSALRSLFLAVFFFGAAISFLPFPLPALALGHRGGEGGREGGGDDSVTSLSRRKGDLLLLLLLLLLPVFGPIFSPLRLLRSTFPENAVTAAPPFPFPLRCRANYHALWSAHIRSRALLHVWLARSCSRRVPM